MSSFVADIRLQDSDEVLQLPVIRSTALKRLLSDVSLTTRSLAASIVPKAEHTLDQYLEHVGKFFGKDPSKWEQVGEPLVETSEEHGKRVIRSTGTYSGTELHLTLEAPYHDARLPVREDMPHLNFNQDRIVITSDAMWHELIKEQPWTPSKRRQLLGSYLQAKLMVEDDPELQLEGAHGMWELSINKEHHGDVERDKLAALVNRLSSPNLEVSKLAAAAIWGMSTSAHIRRMLLELNVMPTLTACVRGSLSLMVNGTTGGDDRSRASSPPPSPSRSPTPMGLPPAAGVSEAHRDDLQAFLLGALSVLLVDRQCRKPLIEAEPNAATLFRFCQDLPGYSPEWAAARREAAARIIVSMLQRDHDARRQLVRSGGIASVLELLEPKGPGAEKVQFCMASLLATVILDDDLMVEIKQRGESPQLFSKCTTVLSATLDRLRQHVTGQMDPAIPFDPHFNVRLAEACAQAMWGSAHYCLAQEPPVVKMEQIVLLGRMGMACLGLRRLPLCRVCHCIAACLATLASDAFCAELIMNTPGDAALATALALVEAEESDTFGATVDIKAAACTCLAFLTCHPIGARGDDCLTGPYRGKLLQVGAFGSLLKAALSSPAGSRGDDIIQQAAAVGIMYLSTAAGAVEPAELAMYAALLTSNSNIEMVEYLMAGMWILMKHPDNRRVLGTAFAVNPAASKLAASAAAASAVADQMQDALEIADVHEQATSQEASKRGSASQSRRATGSAAGSPHGSRRGTLQSPTTGSATGSRRGTSGDAPSGEVPRSRDDALDAPSPVQLFLPEQGGARRGTFESGSIGRGAASQDFDVSGYGHSLTTVDEADNGHGGELSARISLVSGIGEGRDTAIEESLSKLDVHLDERLEENWGLETLVRVGETWLPRMAALVGSGGAPSGPGAGDTPLLKLFEFMTASMCLYVIDDEHPLAQHHLEVFQMSAPPGVSSKTWWTVQTNAAHPEPKVNPLLGRALQILLTMLRLNSLHSWKSIQLAVVMMWNAAARDAGVERHMVEEGVCEALLDLVNNAILPATLRDMAAGHLQAIAETHSNLAFMRGRASPSASPLPGEATHATSPPPGRGHISHYTIRRQLTHKQQQQQQDQQQQQAHEAFTSGIAPFVKAMVLLINTAVPLLELRGSRALARLSFKAPAGAPNPSALLAEIAATAAHLGAINALIELLKRGNQRYSLLLEKHTLVPSRQQSPLTRSGDDYQLYERDLLNMPGTFEIYTYLFSALLNLSVLKANQPKVAKKGLLTLLRTNTLLYQSIMSGAVPEQPMPEGHHNERLLDLLSSIIQNVARHPENRTRMYKAELKGSAAMDKALEASNAASDDEHAAGPRTVGKTAGALLPAVGRHTTAGSGHRSGMLNSSIDSALSAVNNLRPKVVFPPITAGNGQDQETSPRSARSRVQTANRKRGSGAGDAATPDSRDLFLDWLDSTFQESQQAQQGEDGGRHPFMAPGGSLRRSYRRVLYDEDCNVVGIAPDNDAAGPPKALQKLLRRPLHHLWLDNPEARARAGQKRWEPSVSEYREPAQHHAQSRAAAQLMQTSLPEDGAALMDATAQMEHDGCTTSTTVVLDRPPTRERDSGRLAMTVLQPRSDGITSTDLQPSTSGRDSPEILPTFITPTDPKAVPLTVVLAPQRTRTVITFEDKIFTDSGGTRPSLTVFEHVDGAKVSEGLFPHYLLPNGKKAFMYYQGGLLMDQAAVEPVTPPPRPTTVPLALQQGMPLATVLELIAKPPGTAPPFEPYKPVPRLVPLPSRHTLNVKRPEVLKPAAFGDLREDNMQLILSATSIVRTQTTTTEEEIVRVVLEERDPWTLPQSIFRPRIKESDARAFYDGNATLDKMFERDWQRACGKEKFTSMLSRENKAAKHGKADKVALQELHDVIRKHYQQFYSGFVYYAAQGSGDPYHMPLNAYTTFLDDCSIPDAESQSIKRSDCDTIFIVCNFQPDKKSPDVAVNDEHAMMRFEFLECVVRAGIAKYGKGQATDDIATAVSMLFELNILPNVVPAAQVVSNTFRTERLYTEEVDTLLKKHQVILKALYSRYRLKPQGGGLRTKVLKLEGWQQLMQDAHMVDSNLTIQDSELALLWARMYVIDEIKDYARYTSLTFIDFLEALARISDMKSVPPAADLAAAGYPTTLEWALDKERQEGSQENDNMPDIFRPRPSARLGAPKARPLHAKLEQLLDLMFRRLYWDPAQPEHAFDPEALLRMIRKIDKDLGP